MTKINLDILSKGDLFGVQPKVYMDNKEKFQTKFGSFMSFMLFICVCIAIWIYGKELILREKPTATVTEKITKSPTKFNLNNTVFNFA